MAEDVVTDATEVGEFSGAPDGFRPEPQEDVMAFPLVTNFIGQPPLAPAFDAGDLSTLLLHGLGGSLQESLNTVFVKRWCQNDHGFICAQ